MKAFWPLDPLPWFEQIALMPGFLFSFDSFVGLTKAAICVTCSLDRIGLGSEEDFLVHYPQQGFNPQLTSYQHGRQSPFGFTLQAVPGCLFQSPPSQSWSNTIWANLLKVGPHPQTGWFSCGFPLSSYQKAFPNPKERRAAYLQPENRSSLIQALDQPS